MAYYMILLDENPGVMPPDLSPEDIQSIVAKYQAWRDGLASQGRLQDSNKLKDEGGRLMVKQSGTTQVTDGPYSESKEVITGYFVIEAANYDEAVALCQNCPHLDYGRITVREVDMVSCP